MIYIVEIKGPGGNRAIKDYEASSMRAAVRVAELELRGYPQFTITDIWLRSEWEMPVDSEEL
jgi:hypothetical protein